MDYVISTRNKLRKRNAFGGEPGPVRYLRVPGRQLPRPTHQASSERSWTDEVMAKSLPGANASAHWQNPVTRP